MCALPKFAVRCLCPTVLAALQLGAPNGACAQSLTPHPENWRPVVYRDLQLPGPDDRAFVDLWADMIERNNRRYQAAGDRRFVVGNAPAREAQVVVRGGDKTAVLSILDTATDCTAIASDDGAGILVKKCPLRVVVWRSQTVTIRQAQGCFVERTAQDGRLASDPTFAVSYASYDAKRKAIQLGVILAHRAVEACSQSVPLYGENR